MYFIFSNHEHIVEQESLRHKTANKNEKKWNFLRNRKYIKTIRIMYALHFYLLPSPR